MPPVSAARESVSSQDAWSCPRAVNLYGVLAGQIIREGCRGGHHHNPSAYGLHSRWRPPRHPSGMAGSMGPCLAWLSFRALSLKFRGGPGVSSCIRHGGKRHRMHTSPAPACGAGKHAGGVAIHQDAQQHGWVMREAGPRSRGKLWRSITGIQPLDNFHHKARQVLFRQPLINRGRHQEPGLTVARAEVAHQRLSGLAARLNVAILYGCPRGVN